MLIICSTRGDSYRELCQNKQFILLVQIYTWKYSTGKISESLQTYHIRCISAKFFLFPVFNLNIEENLR